MQKNKLWFKAKTYGYGWTPSSWEGWMVLAVYLAFTIWRATTIAPEMEKNQSFSWQFMLEILLPTAVLIWICVKKGEKARWRWGK